MDIHNSYEAQNTEQSVSEHDPFTLERYEQFQRLLPEGTIHVLDIGCNTGRGGARLKEISPDITLSGLDCVQSRLDALPSCYAGRVYGLSNNIPTPDQTYDAIVAGEFLEHLYPSDVDPTLCECQRVLKIGGILLMTTPNPGYLKNLLAGQTVFGTSHLTQHHHNVLKHRLLMHGFSRVKIVGSGKMTRYIGARIPLLNLYGSYLIAARKI
jgi:ubiquinone/menaquinone biosynthesis C-methylase UbiE